VSVVVDASVILAWIYDGERTPAIERVFALVIEDIGWVPAIWHLEVADGLQRAVRQRRIDAAFRTGALRDLADLDIAIDTETHVFAWNDLLALADRFRLTLYDASYLELAWRRGLSLATLDDDLRAAGEALQLQLLSV
jgi:predicted nucleic acid-binding protein